MPHSGNEINRMNCRQFEPYVVDLARATSEDFENTQIAGHLLQCPDCSALLQRERAMSTALKRLDATMAVPPQDPRQEEALLAKFDDRWARTPAAKHRPIWARLAAAGVLAAASLTWHLARRPQPGAVDDPPPTTIAEVETRAVEPAPPTVEGPALIALEASGTAVDQMQTDASFEAVDFVVWPGATAWPPFESGQLIRVDLPVDLLPALGFAEPESEVVVVQADVLVGQDGFARAVRLVQ